MPPKATGPHVVTDEEFKTRVADYNRERGASLNTKKADAAGTADAGKTSVARKKMLIIEAGDLPKVAERVRDILAASGHFFDRGLPVRMPGELAASCPLPRP